jgi:hypothetical protein
MHGFRTFLESEETKDVKEMLGNIPKKHAALVQGHKWVFQSGNVLKGDGEHVGIINDKEKTVTVAAPWRYSREFTSLHEIGHRVYRTFMTPELKKEWSKLLEKTLAKHKNEVKKNGEDVSALNQNKEELFSMIYAVTYCTHKITAFNYKDWVDFIKKVPN